MRALNLLLVDDDPSILRLIEKAVERSSLAPKLKVTAIDDSLRAQNCWKISRSTFC
ncbi:MAG: hypothetical protein QM811_14415 [Pirellulales bacterium]